MNVDYLLAELGVRHNLRILRKIHPEDATLVMQAGFPVIEPPNRLFWRELYPGRWALRPHYLGLPLLDLAEDARIAQAITGQTAVGTILDEAQAWRRAGRPWLRKFIPTIVPDSLEAWIDSPQADEWKNSDG